MYTLLSRLIGSRLPTPVRAALYALVPIAVGLLVHDLFYGLVIGAIGFGGALRQGRKTSFAAAPVVPVAPVDPAVPGTPTATPSVTPSVTPPATPPPLLPPNEGPSIYGT